MSATPLKLRRIRIRGFKSLVDVDLGMPENVLILIGPNGSGKSTILQALAFIHYFGIGRPGQFFEDRDWEPRHLPSHCTDEEANQVDILLSDGHASLSLYLGSDEGEVIWDFTWELFEKQLVRERVWYRLAGAREPRSALHFQAGMAAEVDGADLPILKPPGSLLALLDIERV